MHILTLLPDDSVRRVRETMHRLALLQSVASVDQLEQRLREPALVGSVLIVDPSGLRPDVFERFSLLLESCGLPVLVYTSLNSENAKRVLRLAERAPVDVFLSNVDHDSPRLRYALANLARPSIAALVTQGLAERLRRLQGALQLWTLSLFNRLTIPGSVQAFVEPVDANVHTVQQRLLRAGLANPLRLLWCARLVQAWYPLCELREPLHDVVARLGLKSEEAFRRQFRLCIQLSTRQAIERLDAERFAKRVVAAASR